MGNRKQVQTLLDKYGDNYFKEIGSIGGRKRDAKKQSELLKEKFGEDYFKKLRAKRGKGASIPKRRKV